jgi:Tfp pilus assembly major pilin PilA
MKTGQKGFAALELVLIITIVGMIGGTCWYVYNARQKANNSYAAAETTSSTLPQTIKKKASEPAAQQPAAAQQQPTSAPAVTQTPPKASVSTALVHPTHASCKGSNFTAYVSNPSGAKTYFSASTSGQQHATLAYKTSVTIYCDSYTADGWGVNEDFFVQFSDLSLNKV